MMDLRVTASKEHGRLVSRSAALTHYEISTSWGQSYVSNDLVVFVNVILKVNDVLLSNFIALKISYDYIKDAFLAK
jgi:hypothetical protein